jgi:hypothetical protein
MLQGLLLGYTKSRAGAVCWSFLDPCFPRRIFPVFPLVLAGRRILGLFSKSLINTYCFASTSIAARFAPRFFGRNFKIRFGSKYINESVILSPSLKHFSGQGPAGFDCLKAKATANKSPSKR